MRVLADKVSNVLTSIYPCSRTAAAEACSRHSQRYPRVMGFAPYHSRGTATTMPFTPSVSSTKTSSYGPGQTFPSPPLPEAAVSHIDIVAECLQALWLLIHSLFIVRGSFSNTMLSLSRLCVAIALQDTRSNKTGLLSDGEMSHKRTQYHTKRCYWI